MISFFTATITECWTVGSVLKQGASCATKKTKLSCFKSRGRRIMDLGSVATRGRCAAFVVQRIMIQFVAWSRMIAVRYIIRMSLVMATEIIKCLHFVPVLISKSVEFQILIQQTWHCTLQKLSTLSTPTIYITNGKVEQIGNMMPVTLRSKLVRT